MLKIAQLKNTRIITFVLLFLTLALAALAVVTAVNLQKKENINPTPSKAASCSPRSCVTQENNVAKCLAGDFGEEEKAKCETGDENQSQYIFDRNECNAARQCENGGAPGGACGVFTGSYPNGSCQPLTSGLKGEGEVCSAGTECATGICREATQCVQQPKTCGGQTPSNPALCTPVNATQAPGATSAPVGSGNLADCNGSTTAILRYGINNATDARVRIINCQNNQITETYTEFQCKCDSKDGSGAAGDGSGRACGACTSIQKTVLIPARTNQEVSTTCSLNSCGSCQADLSFPNAGGTPNPVTDGIFKTTGLSCGTGSGTGPSPTRAPNATVTPTVRPSTTQAPGQTGTPVPTTSVSVTSTPTSLDLSVTKSANPSTVSPSGTVTYAAEFKNTTVSPITLVKISDDYSDTFSFQIGSVIFTKPDGSTFSREPVISEGKLVWVLNAGEQVTLDQDQILKISYKMTAASETGTYSNTICLEDPLNRCAAADVVIQTQPNTGIGNSLMIVSGTALTIFGGVSFVILKKRRYLNF